MSLAILVPIVVAGVALIVAAVHFSGLSTRASIPSNRQDIATLFGLDYPLEQVVSVATDRTQAAAFLLLDSGRTGMVQIFGDRFITRLLAPPDLASVATAGATLMIAANDFTWAGGKFTMENAKVAAELAARLSGKGRLEEIS